MIDSAFQRTMVAVVPLLLATTAFGAVITASTLAAAQVAPASTAPGIDSAELLRETRRLFGLRRYREARSVAERLLQAQEATPAFGVDAPQVSEDVDNLVDLYLKMGHYDAAVSTRELQSLREECLVRDQLLNGNEKMKKSAMRCLDTDTEKVVSLNAQIPADQGARVAAKRLAFTTLLRRKGWVLSLMAQSVRALRERGTREDREQLLQLAVKHRELAILVMAQRNLPQARAAGVPTPMQDVDKLKRKADELEQEVDELERKVMTRGAALMPKQSDPTLEGVQAALPEGAVLLEFFRYRPYHYKSVNTVQASCDSAPDPRFQPDHYAVYVLRRDREIDFKDLGDAAPIDHAVDGLRKALKNTDANKTREPIAAAREVYRFIMEPVRAMLGTSQWVFVSPDSELNLVPFAALVDDKYHYLLEEYLFSYVTSGRDLLRSITTTARKEPPLLIADPTFGKVDTSVAYATPLKVTKEEADNIQMLFPEARLRQQAAATEGVVKHVRGPRFLHIATHGVFQSPQDSGAPVPCRQSENPLLSSFLVLAGYNERGDDEADGMLTALEVSDMDLHGTRLVTMSSCESGLGDTSCGEGVYGMRRALAIAGADTQVLSLWKVLSAETSNMMLLYYGQLLEGRGMSDAMRQVQLKMLNNDLFGYNHPNRWASFVVSGDWRRLDGTEEKPSFARVPPQRLGCACTLAGEPIDPALGALGLAAILGAVARRRARRCSRSPER